MSTIAEKLTTIAENEQRIYDKGHEKGIRGFWECFTNKGARINYKNAFTETDFSGITVPSDLFFPSSLSTGMFEKYAGRTLPLGINLNNSGASLCNSLFINSTNLVEIYNLNLRAQTSYVQCFSGCSALKKIELIKVNSLTTFTNAFTNCEALTDIKISGTITKDISFQSSPLNVESMKNIISNLKTYAGTSNEAKYTLTFTTACWTTLEASGKPFDDGLTTDETLTWANYVSVNKGWNI